MWYWYLSINLWVKMIIEEVNIESIIPYQFNNKIHDLTQIDRIANSIKEFWFIQPLVVDQNNILIIWHGRLLASELLQLKEVPVIIRNYSEQEIVEISLIENLQRKDLNPIEEALAYKKLMTDANSTVKVKGL